MHLCYLNLSKIELLPNGNIRPRKHVKPSKVAAYKKKLMLKNAAVVMVLRGIVN